MPFAALARSTPSGLAPRALAPHAHARAHERNLSLRPRPRAQVYGFTLDQNVGEFVLSHDNIKVPDSGKIYSFNEGNYAMWTPGLKKYMDSLKARGRVRTRKARWRSAGLYARG